QGPGLPGPFLCLDMKSAPCVARMREHASAAATMCRLIKNTMGQSISGARLRASDQAMAQHTATNHKRTKALLHNADKPCGLVSRAGAFLQTECRTPAKYYIKALGILL